MHRLAGLVLAVILISSTYAEAAQRAFVIGNGDYRSAGRLKKAVEGAKAVASALGSIGYTISAGENLDQAGLTRLVSAFEKQIERGDTIFFYFAGQGAEVGGETLLLAVDAPEPREGQDKQVRRFALSANKAIAGFKKRGADVVIAALDAGRTNPFGAKAAKAAAAAAEPQGTFLLHASGRGQAALESLGDGDAEPASVFTRALLPQLTTPGLTLDEIAKRTQAETSRLTSTGSQRQIPAYYSTVPGKVLLVPSTGTP